MLPAIKRLVFPTRTETHRDRTEGPTDRGDEKGAAHLEGQVGERHPTAEGGQGPATIRKRVFQKSGPMSGMEAERRQGMLCASGEGERGSFTILTLSVRVVPWNSGVSEPDQQSDAACGLPLLGHPSPTRTPAGAAPTRSADAARSAGRRPRAGALRGADSGAEAGPADPARQSPALAVPERLSAGSPARVPGVSVTLFLPRNAVAPAAVPREIHRRGFLAAAPSLSRDAVCRAREPCHALDGDPSAPGAGCSVPGYPCVY